MQARPERARRYGVAALNRALESIEGTTAVHICFGYAAMVLDKPSGYSFLAELEQSAARQISIETAQPKLDCSVLETLPSKTIILGVLDLSDPPVERPETVAEGLQRAPAFVPADRITVAPACRPKSLARETAFGKMPPMPAALTIPHP